MRRLMLALSLMLLTANCLAQTQAPPSLMNFQGRLSKPDGTPVSDGAYSVRFSLWNAAAGGTELWTQTGSAIAVHNGVFAILLNVGTGTENGATAATLFDNNLWLEIKVGTDAPLSPRQQVASVAYALKAATVPDGSITAAKLAPGAGGGANGAAGGDLTGTYPNPSLKTDASLLYKVSGTLISALSGANNSPDQVQLQSTQSVLDSAWQSFIPSQNGSLTALDIYTGTVSGSPHAAQLVIYDGEGVGGTELSRVTITVSATPGFQFFTLAVPLAVTAGHTYTWYVGRSSSLTFGYAQQDPYGGGHADIGTTLDYAFRTYMTTGGGARISINSDVSQTGRNFEIGAGLTKAANAGKIDYGVSVADALSIFGAGTTTANRKIQLWDEGGLTLIGSQVNNTTSQFLLQVFNPGNATYPTSDPAGLVPGLSITHVVDPNVSSGLGRSVNILAGSDANSIGAGVIGGTVSGGGVSHITNTSKFPNTVTANFGTVSGGWRNTVSGFAGTVPGGDRNVAAGQYSFANGANAQANHDSTFVWNGSLGGNTPFASTGPNQFLVNAPGGVGINTSNPGGFALNVNGTSNFSGAGSFAGSLTAGSFNTGALSASSLTATTINVPTLHGSPTVDGGLHIDLLDLFDGNYSANAAMLRFGAVGSGEGIGSQRVLGQASNQQYDIAFYTASQKRMVVFNDGTVAIGTNISPTNTGSNPHLLNVGGKALAMAYDQTSDARYKTDVATFGNALDTILNLRGVTYQWDRAKWPAKNFPAGRQVGFIAQEIERFLPELVSTDGNGYKSVSYANVVPVLVESVKTLKSQLDEKQKQIDALQEQVRELSALKQQDARIKELEKQLAAVLAALKDGKNADGTTAVRK